jgi:hypothetical protein
MILLQFQTKRIGSQNRDPVFGKNSFTPQGKRPGESTSEIPSEFWARAKKRGAHNAHNLNS